MGLELEADGLRGHERSSCRIGAGMIRMSTGVASWAGTGRRAHSTPLERPLESSGRGIVHAPAHSPHCLPRWCSHSHFDHVGGSSPVDFVGKSDGLGYDVTTDTASTLAKHLARPELEASRIAKYTMGRFTQYLSQLFGG